MGNTVSNATCANCTQTETAIYFSGTSFLVGRVHVFTEFNMSEIYFRMTLWWFSLTVAQFSASNVDMGRTDPQALPALYIAGEYERASFSSSSIACSLIGVKRRQVRLEEIEPNPRFCRTEHHFCFYSTL